MKLSQESNEVLLDMEHSQKVKIDENLLMTKEDWNNFLKNFDEFPKENMKMYIFGEYE